jgi:rifamycin polyketide synthase module 1/2/3
LDLLQSRVAFFHPLATSSEEHDSMTLLYDWLKDAADARGNNKALVYRDNYLSWRGLLHRVDRRAQEFKAMGLKKGAWVGLMLGNVPDFVILALALSKLDVTVVPIDPTTGARELELILACAPLRALVTRPRGSEATGGAPPTDDPRRARDSVPPPFGPADDGAEIRRRLQGTLLTCSVFKKDNPDLGAKASVVLFTSDSLGDPKGVLRTPKNLETTANSAVAELGISVDSRILIAVPLFHAYGWDLGLLPTLRTGATMFVEEEISARRVGKLIRDHDIDVLPGTPSMYRELVKLPTAKHLESKQARYLSGGSKLEPEVAAAMEDKYGTKLISCYHSTEAGVIALDLQAKNPETVGKPIEAIELKFGPPKGKKTTATKQGVIWVKGDALAPKTIGPFRDAAKRKGEVEVGERDGDGWLRTGDLGRLDRAGKLTLEGREDDVVKIEGKRVALGEVEGCLEAFPKVKAAQARLESDPFAGSMVVARVVAAGKVAAEEIIDHCAKNLAPYKVPRRIEFCERI